MLNDIHWVFDLRYFRDWLLYPIPVNQHLKPQVVAATIKSPLSRKREQESEPCSVGTIRR